MKKFISLLIACLLIMSMGVEIAAAADEQFEEVFVLQREGKHFVNAIGVKFALEVASSYWHNLSDESENYLSLSLKDLFKMLGGNILKYDGKSAKVELDGITYGFTTPSIVVKKDGFEVEMFPGVISENGIITVEIQQFCILIGKELAKSDGYYIISDRKLKNSEVQEWVTKFQLANFNDEPIITKYDNALAYEKPVIEEPPVVVEEEPIIEEPEPIIEVWENPFTDVAESDTYYEAVKYVYENNLFKGASDTTFEPDTVMNRAMFVTVLGRYAEVDVTKYTTASEMFEDVKANEWYTPYVQWAYENKLILGYGDGKFGTDDEILNYQMYLIMERFLTMMDIESAFEYDAENETPVTRAEVAMLLYELSLN
jgi:S-layer homology domain.